MKLQVAAIRKTKIWQRKCRKLTLLCCMAESAPWPGGGGAVDPGGPPGGGNAAPGTPPGGAGPRGGIGPWGPHPWGGIC